MRTTLAISLVLLLAACDSSDSGTQGGAMGAAGGPCYGNNTCDGSLNCVSGTCVDPEATGDQPECTSDEEEAATQASQAACGGQRGRPSPAG